MSSIQRNYRETAKDYAYRIIRDSIVNFEKKPGETISDMEISQQLGIIFYLNIFIANRFQFVYEFGFDFIFGNMRHDYLILTKIRKIHFVIIS